MKNDIIFPAKNRRLVRNPNEKNNPKSLVLPLFLIGAALGLAANTSHGANLLANPGFEASPTAHVIPTGWSRFQPPPAAIYQPFGNYWVENAPPVAHSGIYYWKEWGACYDGTNNVAGLYQVFNSSPGSVYQADGWFFIYPTDVMGPSSFTWIEVQFLNSSSNVLALYKSDDFYATMGTSNWFDLEVTNACDVTQPLPLGDPYFTNSFAVTGAVSVLTAPPGTTMVKFQYNYLQGVTSGANDGGSSYFDDATLNQLSGLAPPVIGNLFPNNMIFVPPTNGITFNVSSPEGATINSSGIQLVLNGTNVSSSLAITGSSSNKNVVYHGLVSNMTYNASITVTDSVGFTASLNSYFETTWVGTPPVVYLWEAEDWDFTNGMYLDIPDLCNADGDPNCYFGKVGTPGVDELAFNDTGDHLYRAGDAICTEGSGDYTRPNLAAADRPDYRIDPFVGGANSPGEWVNYTRDWTNGTYWMLGRLCAGPGLSGALMVSVVNPDQTLTELGTFNIKSGLGYGVFQNILLTATNGSIATVALNGKATLQVQSLGNVLPTFFALVAATPDLPVVSGMYPTGTRPFEYTNALSFNVSTFGATFPANSIHVNLDGFDVSSNLVISGSASNKSVVYPTLLPNAMHLAYISVTNSLGHGIVVTNQFDTFNETNYMVETEDFDYEGGQYITNWFPDAYADANGPYPALTNVDFVHTTLSGEVYNYRTGGIPQDGLNGDDYLRQAFVNAGAIDFVLVFFAGGDWANYTRNYPAGNYYAYIRTSGSGPFTMYLDQIVSGRGTTSEVTSRLGTWGSVGTSYTTFGWVPLTDDGLAAPAVVRLNGVGTLRLTTEGDANPNYIMFVPASGIRITAAHSGGNAVLAFQTQAGANYRVFYRNSLSSGNWTLLTTMPGTGGVQHVTDPLTGTQRFYEVVSP